MYTDELPSRPPRLSASDEPPGRHPRRGGGNDRYRYGVRISSISACTSFLDVSLSRAVVVPGLVSVFLAGVPADSRVAGRGHVAAKDSGSVSDRAGGV